MRRQYWILLALLLVAFAIRLAYWQRAAAFGQYDLSYDDDEYFKLGVLFAHGDFTHDPYPLRYTRAPGYSLFLAPIFAGFGPNIEIALVFQVCVSVLMVALTYAVARRAFGPRAGLWAMALMAISPTFASTAGSFLLSETLFSFLILLFIYVFWRWTDAGLSWWRALVAGMVLGLAALVRPMGLYFLPVAALWFLYHERARWKWALVRLVPLAVGMFLLILPYTYRNEIAYQRFFLIDTTSGWTMWRDHRTPNDDFWTKLPTIRNPSDRDRFAFQRGVQNILADPGYQIGVQGVANLAATMRLELDSYARGAGYLSDVMVVAPTVPLVLYDDLFYLFVVIVGVAGLCWAWSQTRARGAPKIPSGVWLLLLWLAYDLLIVFVYHTQSRFRPHYTFVLIVFAGAALAQGRALWQNLNRPARLAWVGATVLALVLAYSPLLAPVLTSEYFLAQSQGHDVAAAQHAVEAYPGYARADDVLGDAYRQAHDFPNALAAYQAALQINPFEMEARLGRMDIFRQQGAAPALAAEVQAAGVQDGEVDMPAPLWWSFQPAPTRRINLGDSSSSFGYAMNFFAIQPDGSKKMRFTRDHSYVKFTGIPSLDPHTLVFSARAVPVPYQPLPTVSVWMNGHEMAQVPLTVNWQAHKIQLNAALRAQDTLVVEFRSPTFRPSEVFEDSDDTRDLGFMLEYVELK